MDFVKKKAFEAQINKVGKDLGLGSNVTSGFSGSSREQARTPAWNVFSGGDDVPAEDVDQSSAIPFDAVGYYDSMPSNFPPLVHLFYVNRSILSDAAKKPVAYAWDVLCATEVLLVFNTLISILFTVLEKGNKWYFLLVSAVVTVLVTIYELFTFEIAFRGAYQSSTGLRKQYIYLSGVNIAIMTLYAFLGVGFFNGWTRIGYLNREETKKELNHASLRKVLTILEALLWTVLLFVNIYSLFDYYHFVREKQQGLSPNAIAVARRSQESTNTNSNDVIPPESSSSRGRGGNKNARIQEIKDRYRNEEV